MLSEYKNRINQLIIDFIANLRARHGRDNQMIDMIEYALINDSKKLRSIIILIVGEILGLSLDDLKNYLLAVEITHTYTLVHDDLPALDNDDYRRNKLTAHKKFGEANAILLGDTMQTLAFELISEQNPKFSCEKTMQIINFFAKTIGGLEGVIFGEFLDINYKLDNINELKKIHLYKTAVFFEFCLSLCPKLISNNNDLIASFSNLGTNYGLVFQLIDDYDDFGKTVKNEPNICNMMQKDELHNLYNQLLSSIYDDIKKIEEFLPQKILQEFVDSTIIINI